MSAAPGLLAQVLPEGVLEAVLQASRLDLPGVELLPAAVVFLPVEEDPGRVAAEGALRAEDLDVEDVTAAWDEELDHAGTKEEDVDAMDDTREGGMEDLGLGEE